MRHLQTAIENGYVDNILQLIKDDNITENIFDLTFNVTNNPNTGYELLELVPENSVRTLVERIEYKEKFIDLYKIWIN